jgi:hypothetical protein
MPVGDFGRDRDRTIRLYNKKVGEGNWFWGFRAKRNLYSWDLGMQFYEDAYWNLFRTNVKLLKEVLQYQEVFILSPKDIESGLDYRCQKDMENHYCDIAIRRSLRRLGVWFKGTDERSLNLAGSRLNPQIVKFHLKHLLDAGEDDCVESWIFNHRVAIIADEIADQHKLAEILIR